MARPLLSDGKSGIAAEFIPECLPCVATRRPSGRKAAATLSPRAERKLEQVIDGARAVIVAKGFEGASVDDIAREAGISKATMYRYFPDKIALFQAVMSRECRASRAPLSRSSTAAGRSTRSCSTSRSGTSTSCCRTVAIDAFRTAVAESARFPALARDFYERRMDKARVALVPLMAAAARPGRARHRRPGPRGAALPGALQGGRCSSPGCSGCAAPTRPRRSRRTPSAPSRRSSRFTARPDRPALGRP